MLKDLRHSFFSKIRVQTYGLREKTQVLILALAFELLWREFYDTTEWISKSVRLVACVLKLMLVKGK